MVINGDQDENRNREANQTEIQTQELPNTKQN